MGRIIYLDSSNFFVGKGTKGPMLFNNIKGLSFVFFHYDDCKGCKISGPIFQELSESFGNECKFGSLNVGNNREVLARSKNTITPIVAVPMFILYVDGKPYIEYNQEISLQKMRAFINVILSRINDLVSGSEKGSSKKEFLASHSENGMGIPSNVICDDEKCYLNFEDAYASPDKKTDRELCYLKFDEAYGVVCE